MSCYSTGLKNPDARHDFGLKFASPHSFVVLGLQVDPKTRLHAEIDTQAQRRGQIGVRFQLNPQTSFRQVCNGPNL